MIKKSAPFYSSFSENSVDEVNGVIKNVVILQSGVDKSGEYFDQKSLEQLITLGNSQGQGVKSRNGHPNMCDSSLGTFIGRYKNFSLSTNAENKAVVVADLHLDKQACEKAPSGNVYDYILTMAKSNNDMFGNSIVYNQDKPESIKTVQEDGTEKVIGYQRIKSFIASDLVDSPCATTSLFKSTNGFVEVATQFLDENPEILELTEKNENLVGDFLKKYKLSKTEEKKIDMAKEIKEWKEKLKGFLGVLESHKDFTIMGDTGVNYMVTDTDGDGVVMVGDVISDETGMTPVVDATITTDDGAMITTDGSGVVTSVTEPMALLTEAPLEAEQKAFNELKAKYDLLVAEDTENKELAEKSIATLSAKVAELTKRLDTIKSNFKPEVSGTQFPITEKETKEERKNKIAEARKK